MKGSLIQLGFTILNIVIFVLLLAGLFVMAKKHVSFSKRVFTALGIGIVLGAIMHLAYGAGFDRLHLT